jgi:hypothetical protein
LTVGARNGRAKRHGIIDSCGAEKYPSIHRA